MLACLGKLGQQALEAAQLDMKVLVGHDADAHFQRRLARPGRDFRQGKKRKLRTLAGMGQPRQSRSLSGVEWE
jgi:hypothetical protein